MQFHNKQLNILKTGLGKLFEPGSGRMYTIGLDDFHDRAGKVHMCGPQHVVVHGLAVLT